MDNRAVIFDLDGTLLDTLSDLAAAANRTLASQGYPTHPVEAYRWFVGDGTAMLIERAMPADQRSPEKIKACLKIHLQDYEQHWAEATRPYEGIAELLALLSRRRIPFAVVTNKPHESALSSLAHFFPDIDFGFICGLGPGIAKKPDPAQALAAARAMGVSPEHCLFLGDSGVDVQAARNAAMVPVGAAWGYRTSAELIEAGAWRIIRHPMDLAGLI
jgi:phosphoglycolate phosphatase